MFDALVQAVVSYDLLGYAYPERLNGLFDESWIVYAIATLMWGWVTPSGWGSAR